MATVVLTQAQNSNKTVHYTKADTLRGSITAERAWWDVQYYAVHVTPDIVTKTINGFVDISYRVVAKGSKMQIDLQQPLIIDSILNISKSTSTSLVFERSGNIAYALFEKQQKLMSIHTVRIYYHGKPQEARNPPWDGGVTWSKDKNGSPFVSTSCQGLGASIWWPCKDHQSDEPENGASISITTPDSLMDVSNGLLQEMLENKTAHTKTWKWAVKNPINNYSLSMNIAKYANFSDTLHGEAGVLPLNYYVLNDDLEAAKIQFQQAKNMLHCFEYWFGKYPFYEDSYKLIEVPYLGMEHQSAVTYGNKFKNGYLGRDLSGSGWGLKWDFIIVHESGHEWFGNNITSKDIADMWIHEGFTSFSETLYTDWVSGKQAGNEYNFGIRRNIRNTSPIIGAYGVNGKGGDDMYYKTSNMLQTIRNAMNDDAKFRLLLRNLNANFYHQTVTALDIQNSMSTDAGFDLSKIFEQYLKGIQIPVLELSVSNDSKKISYRWTNCVDGFNLPIYVTTATGQKKLLPKSNEVSTIDLAPGEASFFNAKAIEFNYFIKVKEVKTAQ